MMGCDRKIGPFDCCSVVQGDCLELMKQLEWVRTHELAVISDPPYGMSWASECFSGGNNRSNRQPGRHTGVMIAGDDRPFDPTPFLRFDKVILWGCNHFARHLERGTTLVWIKRFDDAFGTFLSDAEMAWMKGGMGVYCKRDLSMNAITNERVHPTQKPEPLMRWCIEKLGNPETILDPYSGSGTTLVAAKKLGRHFLGFEISPEYCEIARKRIAAIEAQPTLFEPKPIQEELGL